MSTCCLTTAIPGGRLVYRRTNRSNERRSRRQSQILAAARLLFARHGYGETTMQQIATRARTSIGNLYFYFANKETLLRALLERAMDAEWAQADAIADEVPEGPARLAVMVFCNADWLLVRDREMIRMLVESSAIRHVADWVAEHNAERLSRYMLANVPELVGDDLVGVVAMWGGAGRGSVEASLRGERPLTPRARASAVLRWNLRGLGVTDQAIDKAVLVAERALSRHAER